VSASSWTEGQGPVDPARTPGGVPDLDRDALALPRHAPPLPKPPEDRPGDTLELVVPIEFFPSPR